MHSLFPRIWDERRRGLKTRERERFAGVAARCCERHRAHLPGPWNVGATKFNGEKGLHHLRAEFTFECRFAFVAGAAAAAVCGMLHRRRTPFGFGGSFVVARSHFPSAGWVLHVIHPWNRTSQRGAG
jgi:hypothetical protein